MIAVADVHKFDLDVAGVVPGWCLWSDIEVTLPDKPDARRQFLKRAGVRQESTASRP